MNQTKIVLEYGVNHEDSLEKACRAIRVAADLGVWGIKFQYYNAKEMGKNFDYNLELQQFEYISYNAKFHNIEWGISLFDSTWNDLNEFINMGVNFVKIAGSQSNDIGKIISLIPAGTDIVISVPEIYSHDADGFAFECRKRNRNNLIFLTVKNEYPCFNPPLEKVNKNIGYSCHTPGYEAMFLAALKNPPMIEKHFTLNHNTSNFRDHKHAITPDEFRIYEKRVQEVTNMKG